MDQKPYYTLDAWCKERYGEKLYKIALDAGLTCPNRDGTKGSRGCIFCSAGGSGDFAGRVQISGNGSIIGVVKLNIKVTGLNYVLTGSNRISEPCESGTN